MGIVCSGLRWLPGTLQVMKNVLLADVLENEVENMLTNMHVWMNVDESWVEELEDSSTMRSWWNDC